MHWSTVLGLMVCFGASAHASHLFPEAASALRKAAEPAAKKEPLLVFDCKPPGSAAVAKQFGKIYDVRVVELEPGKKESELLQLISDRIRSEKTRNIAVFCHGTWGTEKYTLYREDEKDKEKHAFEIDGKKLRETVDRAVRAAGLRNTIFFLNTCGALGIKTTFRPGESCVGANGTICAACPANLPAKGDLMAKRLVHVYDNCAKYDRNRDGKIDVAELEAAFAPANAAEEKRIRSFLDAERKKFLEKTKIEAKSFDESKATFEKLFLMEQSHQGAPFLLGKDNAKTVVFACP